MGLTLIMKIIGVLPEVEELWDWTLIMKNIGALPEIETFLSY